MAGRQQIQADKIASSLTRRQLVELNACTRCGECQVWCPVYAEDKRELITARSKLASLQRLVEDRFSDTEQQDLLDGLYQCSACGQCHVVCPIRINTHELWEQARAALVRAGIPQPENQVKQLTTIKQFNNSLGKPQAERGAWAKAAWKAGLLKAPVPLWNERRASVLYFAGCAASFDPALQPVAVQSARLLQEAGVDFAILGEDEPCCISKLRRMGDNAFPEEAKKRATQLDGLDNVLIIVSCAGCFKGLHSDYSRIWPASRKVMHLSQFLDQLIRDGRLTLKREVPLRVTYHDPCHLGRHNQVYAEPRRVLQSVPGVRFAEMRRHGAFSACCGMGGGLKAVSAEIQHKMGASRIREAEKTHADAVVTPCQTCLQGLLNGKKEANSEMQVLHLNDLLVRSICPELTHEAVETVLAQHIAK